MLSSLDGAERFQAVLGTRPCSRSAHFMLHYRAVDKLSTGRMVTQDRSVDESEDTSPAQPVAPPEFGVHLGLVVPKRHAKRAVTRNLVRREARAQMARSVTILPPGDWVLRLRAPFDRTLYSSAASAALLSVVREEMSRLIADGVRVASKVAGASR
ncbi:ribonuclease P protein component [Sphaerotilus mobilis]|uniref:Ribonuclease P protein component n=1 Tax=Sphaerotilus mobilis TaxID=47994 RepID=A0A4Q7LFV2_9BURK|nr:ribonuclease P protein component [Sphaerotilus mobilis]RZS53356.1 ribonuclease P protein component [Sphaerotilus mobilis]